MIGSPQSDGSVMHGSRIRIGQRQIGGILLHQGGGSGGNALSRFLLPRFISSIKRLYRSGFVVLGSVSFFSACFLASSKDLIKSLAFSHISRSGASGGNDCPGARSHTPANGSS